jgi:hypothetical protein
LKIAAFKNSCFKNNCFKNSCLHRQKEHLALTRAVFHARFFQEPGCGGCQTEGKRRCGEPRADQRQDQQVGTTKKIAALKIAALK